MAVPSTPAYRSIAALLCFVFTAALGLGADQWSKQAAFSKLCDGVQWMPDGTVRVINPRPHDVLPGWVQFEVTANRGAVFGFGQGRQTLFIAVSVLAIGFLGYLFLVSGRQHFYQIILGMLLAGVVGNLYDRVQFNYVRDMIHALPRWPKLFPYIFNVADSLLCVGVGLMIVHSFLNNPAARPAQSQSAD